MDYFECVLEFHFDLSVVFSSASLCVCVFFFLSGCSTSYMGFPHSSVGKSSACNAGDPGSTPGLGRHLEKEMATHCSIPLWKIPWTEEPGGLQSMGSQEVGHDLVTEYTCTSFLLCNFSNIHKSRENNTNPNIPITWP